MSKRARKREMTNLKSDMTPKTQLLEPLYKQSSLVPTLSSNMTQLMKSANNFMPDKRKSLLLPLKERPLMLLNRESAEPD